MTQSPEERARAIRLPQGDQHGYYSAPLEEDHVKIVASAIESAVAEEREETRGLLEEAAWAIETMKRMAIESREGVQIPGSRFDEIAAAIRSRGTQAKGEGGK